MSGKSERIYFDGVRNPPERRATIPHYILYRRKSKEARGKVLNGASELPRIYCFPLIVSFIVIV